jgi:hypothetical protein
MADDPLEFLKSPQETYFTPGWLRAKRQGESPAKLILGIMGAALAAVLAGVWILSGTMDVPPKPHVPTTAEIQEAAAARRDADWTNGPTTYAEALSVWKDEMDVYGRMSLAGASDGTLAAQRERVNRAAYRKARLERP